MSNLERATSAKFSKLPEFECVKLGRAKTYRDVLSSPVFRLSLWEEVERGGWVGAGVRHKLSARHGRRTGPRMRVKLRALKFYFKKVGIISLCDDTACGGVRTHVTPPPSSPYCEGGASCPVLTYFGYVSAQNISEFWLNLGTKIMSFRMWTPVLWCQRVTSASGSGIWYLRAWSRFLFVIQLVLHWLWENT